MNKPLHTIGRTILVMVLSISFISLKAQDEKKSSAMSLQQSIEYALQHQGTYQNARLDEKIADAKVNEIRGIGLPQINASGEFQYFYKIPTMFMPDFLTPAVVGVLLRNGDKINNPDLLKSSGTFFPVQFGTKYTANYGASASQLLFDGGYIIGLKAAAEYTRLSKKMTEKTKIDVIENVTKAYYGVLVNKERSKLLDVNITRLKKVFDDTKAYNMQGFVEAVDVNRIEVAYNNLLTEKEKVARLLDLSVYLLKFQMGMNMNDALTLTDSLDYSKIKMENSEAGDFKQRIEYRLTQSSKELYSLDKQRHMYSYLPSLVAYGTASNNANRNEFNFFDSKEKWFPTVIFGGKLSVPIFDGLQKHARMQQADYNLQKVKNDELNLQNLIEMQMKMADVTYQNALKSLETQKRNMTLAEEVARVTRVKYQGGVGSNLELSSAEAELRTAQINYFDALYNAIIARVDLQKAKGNLTN